MLVIVHSQEFSLFKIRENASEGISDIINRINTICYKW